MNLPGEPGYDAGFEAGLDVSRLDAGAARRDGGAGAGE